MKILIDHVHAFGTDIRTTPDGTLDEVLLTRRIANSVVHDLRRAALDTSLLVPEPRCEQFEIYSQNALNLQKQECL